MKINKLNIIAFGGIKNLSLDFENGLNCIYGDNENGKTTIMSFIKMMFYGNERGSAQISKNMRKKYTPWDGSIMAGSIDFELNGRNFKLEREFRSSNSTDKVFLTDLDLGEKEPVDSEIGAKLFGLSSGAFERSIFIGQFGFPDSDSSAESEINARLSNMVSTGDEKVSFETVNTRLQKARFALISKSGRSGEYDKNITLANELKLKLEIALSSQKKYKDGKEKLLEYSKETDEIVKKTEQLKLKLSKEQDVKNSEKLKELLLAKKELEELKLKLKLKDGTPADENHLRNIQFCISKSETAAEKVKQKKKEAQLIQTQIDSILNAPSLSADETPETINKAISDLNDNLESLKEKELNTQNKLNKLKIQKESSAFKKPFNPIFLVFGFILILCCIIGFTTNLLHTVASIILGMLGVLAVITGFILKPKDNHKLQLFNEELCLLENSLKTIIAHKGEIKEQVLTKKAKLEAIGLALNSNSDLIEKQKENLKTCEKEIKELEEKESIERNNLTLALENLGITDLSQINTVLDTIAQNFEKQKELKQKINFLLKDLNNISYEEAQKKLSQMGELQKETSDFEKMKSEYESALTLITDRRAKESAVAAELKILLNDENPENIEKQLSSLIKTMEQQKSFCDSADIAMETLLESFAELRQNFGSKLESLSAEIFSKLTAKRYSDMTISRNFRINVEESIAPISRDSDYLSSGTVDQAYLSLRLAVSKLLSEKQTLPLFLDDSLAQYDDFRAKTTIEFLKEYSTNGQIIMFTCHKSLCDFSENAGGTVKHI